MPVQGSVMKAVPCACTGKVRKPLPCACTGKVRKPLPCACTGQGLMLQRTMLCVYIVILSMSTY